MDPTQTRKAHEVLMCEANREATFISAIYSIWIDPLYFMWDKFIPTLEKYFPDLLDEILSHNNQRSASVNGEFTTGFRYSHTTQDRHRPPSLRFPQPRNRA